MNYFPVGGVSGKIKVDGKEVDLKNFDLITRAVDDLSLGYAPHNLRYGKAFVYNDKLHVIGGYGNADSDSYKMHYVWERPSRKIRLDNLPFRYIGSSLVVYNGDIHVLGGQDNKRLHYKWNPTDGWTQLDNIPYDFNYAMAVVYGDDIHILGGQYYNSSTSQTEAENEHYKWNPTDGWTRLDNIPYRVRNASVVVYDNNIHLLGGMQSESAEVNSQKHYKWNPTDGWTQLADTPVKIKWDSAVVFENEIHIFQDTTSDSGNLHWMWSPTNGWHGHSVGFDSGYYFAGIGVVVLYNHIHVFTAYNTSYRRYMLDYRDYLFIRKDEKIY